MHLHVVVRSLPNSLMVSKISAFIVKLVQMIPLQWPHARVQHTPFLRQEQRFFSYIPWQLHMTNFNNDAGADSLCTFTGFSLSPFWVLCRNQRHLVGSRLFPSQVCTRRYTPASHVGGTRGPDTLIWMPPCCWIWLLSQSRGFYQAYSYTKPPCGTGHVWLCLHDSDLAS